MPFDWEVFTREDYLLFLLGGALVTAFVSVIAQMISLSIGLLLALMHGSRHSLISKSAKIYIWIFRGTPLLIQLIIIYGGLPQIGIRLSVLQSAIIGLGLNGAAYVAEIFRASIISVDEQQIEAARIDGANEFVALRLIILPQALRYAIPPLGNEFIAMIKNSSLASAISLAELLHRTTLLISSTFRSLELLTLAALFYLIMTSILSYFQNKLEARFQKSISG